MSEIEIDIKAKIFDDPEYCETKNGSYCCPYIKYVDEGYCELFRYSLRGSAVKKCQQCKEAWQAKQMPFPPNVIDKSYPGDDC
jgi:hypothetical protein